MGRVPGPDTPPPALGSQTEVLILGNGPSLLGRNWEEVPRETVAVIGVNQSWRVFPDPDFHFSADPDQFLMPEAQPYYERMARAGKLYHFGQGDRYFGARKIDRHDELNFGRHAFRWRHRGTGVPHPGVSKDGGAAMVAKHLPGGSSCYVALQMAVTIGFATIWFVGLDMSDLKFTGQKSEATKHDRLWAETPADVKERVRVIEPSSTKNLTVVPWPWGSR